MTQENNSFNFSLVIHNSYSYEKTKTLSLDVFIEQFDKKFIMSLRIKSCNFQLYKFLRIVVINILVSDVIV